MSLQRLTARDLAYADRGDGDRGTVLALHSLGTDHRVWDGVADALVAAGYRVLAPDSRGHGASDGGPPPDAGAWVHDLDAVLDGAEVADAHVLGVSMGCAQALELALRRPHRVRSLVLTGGFGHLDPDDARAKVEGLSQGAATAGMAAWARRYAADTLVTSAPEAHRLVEETVAAVDLEVYTASARATFEPRSGHLRDVGAPALVVWGERDAKTPEEMSLALVDDLPQARLRRVPGAGHLAPLDASDAFAEVLLDFLAEVDRSDDDRPEESA